MEKNFKLINNIYYLIFVFILIPVELIGTFFLAIIMATYRPSFDLTPIVLIVLVLQFLILCFSFFTNIIIHFIKNYFYQKKIDSNESENHIKKPKEWIYLITIIIVVGFTIAQLLLMYIVKISV